MSHAKNTRGNIVDYSILAGKSHPSNSKQNGGLNKENSASTKDDESGNSSESNLTARGEQSSLMEGSQKLSKMVDPNVELTEGRNLRSKMASMERVFGNEEKFENKTVRRQIVANARDSRTGSMMPVVLEQIVDNTRSKIMGKKVCHMPSMAGDGMHPLNLAVENKSNVDDSCVSGKQKRRLVIKKQKRTPKVDSDLEIVAELSGDSDG